MFYGDLFIHGKSFKPAEAITFENNNVTTYLRVDLKNWLTGDNILIKKNILKIDFHYVFIGGHYVSNYAIAWKYIYIFCCINFVFL